MALLFAKRFSGRVSTTIQGQNRIFGGGIRRCSTHISDEQLLCMGPCLMFADRVNDTAKREGATRRCYSFACSRVFDIPAPKLRRRKCWGTQYGYLLTVGGHNGHQMQLFNPLTQHRLRLPSLRTFGIPKGEMEDTYVLNTFSLSSDPSSGSPVVMATYGGGRQLAYASPGDRAWKSLNIFATVNVTFHKGHFYSINDQSVLSIIDIANAATGPKEICIADFRRRWRETFYLVEISGDLHLIVRTYEHPDDDSYLHETTDFDVYKFDSDGAKWIDVHNLNGHALFVGNNSTFAISPSNSSGIMAGCVYFSDEFKEAYDDHDQCCDMGVYDYATKTLLKPFYKDKDSYSKFSRPFYFLPSRGSF